MVSCFDRFKIEKNLYFDQFKIEIKNRLYESRGSFIIMLVATVKLAGFQFG